MMTGVGGTMMFVSAVMFFVVVFATMPFSFEGTRRREQADAFLVAPAGSGD